MRHERRRFLAAGLAVTGLAGCLGDDGDDGSNASSGEDATPTATPIEEPEYDLSVEHDIGSWEGYDPDWEPPVDPPALDAEVETVIEELEVPWDLAFAPNGDLFVSERVGRITRYEDDELEEIAAPDVIDHADSVAPGEDGDWWDGGSEGGLMGIAVHPNYPRRAARVRRVHPRSGHGRVPKPGRLLRRRRRRPEQDGDGRDRRDPRQRDHPQRLADRVRTRELPLGDDRRCR